MWNSRLCLGIIPALGISEREQIQLMKQVGFDGFFSGYQGAEYIAKMRMLADEYDMIYQSVHAPFHRIDAMWTTGAETEEVVAELIDCVNACADQGVKIMVCHVFIGFDLPVHISKAGFDNFGRVFDAARRRGVTVALENTEGEEYLHQLMEHFRDDSVVKFCLDTGHELCYNRGADMLERYGTRLVATHLNDNLGISDRDGKIFWTDDLHLLPFDGIADWENISRRLNRCHYDGCLTFELNVTSKPNRHENDIYSEMSPERYITEVYKRACRVAALKQRCRESL